MVHTYTPTYYSSLQDSITSICKNILPFSFKKRRLPAIAAAEQRLSKQQSDNLKWQQDSFHQILNLMARCKEGILSENEVSAFRTHLLETLIASPVDHEPAAVLRDKLIFLQELLYAKCISDEEYHASKRPLLQRLAVQGAEIDARDVIVAAHKADTSNEEWSVIDLKDDDNKHILTSKNKSTESSSSVKRKIQGAASVFGFISPDKNRKLRDQNVNNAKEVESKPSILMAESLPPMDKVKSGKKAWIFDGFKKWKKNDEHEDDEAEPVDEASSTVYIGKLIPNPVAEGPDTRQIKRKLHPDGGPTDFFVDKVLGERIKKELYRIQTELCAKNPNVHLSDDEIEAISTRLPVDKADLKMFFPKSWCDEYGDIVLDIVRKEFKEHMKETGKSRGEKLPLKKKPFRDENAHPNNGRVAANSRSSIDKGFKYNPFFDM